MSFAQFTLNVLEIACRCETLAKKTKAEEVQRGRSPGKPGGTGLKRSCSFNVKPRSAETGIRHVRGYSGERPQRTRTGSASSDRSGRKTPVKSATKPTVTMPTTPTLLK